MHGSSRSVTVYSMTDAEKDMKDRKLRLLESAAASALYNGATVEEARARFEAGIAETLASPIYAAQQERAKAAVAA